MKTDTNQEIIAYMPKNLLSNADCGNVDAQSLHSMPIQTSLCVSNNVSGSSLPAPLSLPATVPEALVNCSSRHSYRDFHRHTAPIFPVIARKSCIEAQPDLRQHQHRHDQQEVSIPSSCSDFSARRSRHEVGAPSAQRAVLRHSYNTGNSTSRSEDVLNSAWAQRGALLSSADAKKDNGEGRKGKTVNKINKNNDNIRSNANRRIHTALASLHSVIAFPTPIMAQEGSTASVAAQLDNSLHLRVHTRSSSTRPDHTPAPRKKTLPPTRRVANGTRMRLFPAVCETSSDSTRNDKEQATQEEQRQQQHSLRPVVSFWVVYFHIRLMRVVRLRRLARHRQHRQMHRACFIIQCAWRRRAMRKRLVARSAQLFLALWMSHRRHHRQVRRYRAVCVVQRYLRTRLTREILHIFVGVLKQNRWLRACGLLRRRMRSWRAARRRAVQYSLVEEQRLLVEHYRLACRQLLREEHVMWNDVVHDFHQATRCWATSFATHAIRRTHSPVQKHTGETVEPCAAEEMMTAIGVVKHSGEEGVVDECSLLHSIEGCHTFLATLWSCGRGLHQSARLSWKDVYAEPANAHDSDTAALAHRQGSRLSCGDARLVSSFSRRARYTGTESKDDDGSVATGTETNGEKIDVPGSGSDTSPAPPQRITRSRLSLKSMANSPATSHDLTETSLCDVGETLLSSPRKSCKLSDRLTGLTPCQPANRAVMDAYFELLVATESVERKALQTRLLRCFEHEVLQRVAREHRRVQLRDKMLSLHRAHVCSMEDECALPGVVQLFSQEQLSRVRISIDWLNSSLALMSIFSHSAPDSCTGVHVSEQGRCICDDSSVTNKHKDYGSFAYSSRAGASASASTTSQGDAIACHITVRACTNSACSHVHGTYRVQNFRGMASRGRGCEPGYRDDGESDRDTRCASVAPPSPPPRERHRVTWSGSHRRDQDIAT